MNIEKIIPVENYVLYVKFDNGSKKLIDLEPFLTKSTHPLINKYLNKRLFKKVYIDYRNAPCWGDNEFDINPQSIINGDFDIK